MSYLGSLVQFSPAAGRAGRCRQTSLCVDSTPRVLATLGLPRTGVSVLSPSTLLRLPAVLYGAGPALSVVAVVGSSTEAQIRLRLRVVSSPPQLLRQPEACAPSSQMRSAFPSAAPARAAVGSQEVFRQEPGPVCRVGGRGFSGAEFAPFPSPLPPTSSEDGPALLWSFSVPLFCEPPRCVPAG